MHCNDIQRQLDDYLDCNLSGPEQSAIDQHLQRCHVCRAKFAQAQRLKLALHTMPVTPPRRGYEQRVLGFLQTPPHPSPRFHVPLWFATGFATAMFMIVALWFMLSPGNRPDKQISAVTLHVIPQQIRKVDLIFNSPAHIQRAILRIELPADVELEGYEQRRILEWQTELKQGSNRLSLPLIAKGQSDGTLTASISAKGKTRTFRVHIVTTNASSQRTSLNLTV
jgi:hypothetical protein